jgi:hypothetical protein
MDWTWFDTAQVIALVVILLVIWHALDREYRQTHDGEED